MQNLIVFCQRCFTWIEPQSDMCPECSVEIVLDQPDPASLEINDILGNPLTVLGPVRVERKGLPNVGYVVATTRGLLFLPRLHRRINGAWESIASQRTPKWWPFQGDVSSPRFLKWLRRPLAASAPGQSSTPLSDPHVRDHELGSLADRLMESPGGFFVERRLIQAVSARRRTYKIDRPPLRSITLVDETDEGSLGTALHSLTVPVAS